MITEDEFRTRMDAAARVAGEAIAEMLRASRDVGVGQPSAPAEREQFRGDVLRRLYQVRHMAEQAAEGFNTAGVPPPDPDTDDLPWL